jgi:hypothetical protein
MTGETPSRTDTPGRSHESRAHATPERTRARDERAQANLVAVAVGLILLTVVATAAVTLADGALAGADRDPRERHAAAALADRLVAPDSPVTERANAVNESAARNLTAADVDALAPAVENRSVAVGLGGETILARGDPSGGTTVRRVVLAGTRVTQSRTVSLSERARLPNRTDRLRIRIDPGGNTTVHTVRVNDRVVLYDPDGLSGTTTVETTRLANATVRFGTGGNSSGTATVTGYPLDATATTLEVTVGE